MKRGGFVPCICVSAHGNPECRRHPAVDRSPLDVACPKCGAGVGWNCNPHTDKETGKPAYREPHRRRVEAAQCMSQAGGPNE